MKGYLPKIKELEKEIEELKRQIQREPLEMNFVSIPGKEFEMLDTPVTQHMWEEVMESNPSRFKGPNRPVECVSWFDAQEMIKKLNERNDGYRYRLPTEEEWKYCCRAGTKTPYPFEDESKFKEYIHCEADETCDIKTHKPNAWGLYDMLGNVWEWCQDEYK